MSADELLKNLLQRVNRRQRTLQLWATLACCWGLMALLASAVLMIERQTGWASWLAMPVLTAAALLAALILVTRRAGAHPDWRQLARQIEKRDPQLDGRLLTAIQQTATPGAELNYLQQRVLEETLLRSRQDDWADIIPKSRIVLAQTAHWLALTLLALVLLNLPKTEKHDLLARISDFSVTVTPGDTSIERGNSLVILARFGKVLPPGVELVIKESLGTNRHIQLAKSLADPIFGGSVAEVLTNLGYHLEYAGQRTRDFKVTVFEYPRLERADADLSFPDYTGQPPKRIENTKRLSAVEGTRVDLTLQLNKPVSSAQLITKDKERVILPLQVETNRAAAVLKQFPLMASKSYELQLVDAEGRTNKVASQFVFDALKNRPPELKLVSPRNDLRPSALEEVSFEGTVWDDFGIESYGLAYTVPGEETRFVELGGKVPAKQKSPFKYVLRMEDLGIQPDQLVAWFAWADDLGADGQLRRTPGDLFFAEVRAFDEIFREGQADDGAGGGGGQPGGQSVKLLELQKKIISATWNLQRQHGTSLAPERKNPTLRDGKLNESSKPLEVRPRQSDYLIFRPRIFGQAAPSASRPTARITVTNSTASRSQSKLPTYQEDAAVLRDSQSDAIEQAEAAAERQRDPRAVALWAAAVKEMEKALALLSTATNTSEPLPKALAAEQAAYQALLKLQEHEYQVMRAGKNRSQGGGSASERMQRQLEQMEMTQSENRYETQRQAQRPQNNQVREQLQVMNRLQELARRQQDLNERLKELQTALQEARTEQEREEIRRRLKRLQEEEQQMLADVDEVRQRMDRPENQSSMADERRQLEQTREDVQRAAQASSQGSASQALAAGTRAQRQLQELRDQMRKESSNQFAEDLRQMRSDARELLRQQEDILKKLDPENSADKGPKPLSDAPEREQLMNQLAQQKERLTNLVDHATQVSEQAEVAEPLLSRQLYDTLRKFSQDNVKNMKQTEDELVRRGLMNERHIERWKQSSEPDASKLLDITSEMLRQDVRRQASETAKRSGGSINEFKQGVERAAESVLGDDTEALRLAQDELGKLAEQLQREMAQEGENGASTNQTSLAGQGRNSASPRSDADAQQPAGSQAANDMPQDRDSTQPGSESQGGKSQGANASRQPNEQAKGSSQGQESSGEQSSSPTEGQQSGGDQQNQSSGPGSKAGGNSSARNGQQANSDANNPTTSGAAQRGQRAGANRGGAAANNGYGNDWGGAWLNNFNRSNDDGTWQGGPLTGGDFGPWSDRLREVEEVLEFPDLRNEVATARERARLLRQDFKRDQKKPDWAVVRLQVMKPLLEVRDRVVDELARRESNDALVPIDRDPVPTRYSDLVRRYYEELGKNKTPATPK